MAAAALEELKGQVEALLAGGSRYQMEKIATIGVYLIVVIVTVVWVFMGNDPENELGASWGFETIAPLNDQILFLENTSDDDWTGVRIVLNRQYLYKSDEVEAGSRLSVRPEEFSYFFYIPRPWGRSGWETLSDEKKPAETGDPQMEARLLEVRADQGRLDIDLEASPESP